MRKLTPLPQQHASVVSRKYDIGIFRRALSQYMKRAELVGGLMGYFSPIFAVTATTMLLSSYFGSPAGSKSTNLSESLSSSTQTVARERKGALLTRESVLIEKAQPITEIDVV